MRSSLVLFFALVLQVLTSVATNPTPSGSRPRGPKKYYPGDIIRVKPSAWETAEGKTPNHGSNIEHFGVVLKKNGGNKYQVAHISHNLPAEYTHRDDASKYHKKADATSMINTGTPKQVSGGDLRLAKHPWGWNKMSNGRLKALKTEINKNCPGSLRRRGLGCPVRKPNQNTPKGQSRQVQGKNPGPKPTSQNTRAKGQSPLPQGKKAGPRPNQNTPKGQSRQVQGNQAAPKPNRPAPQSKSGPVRGKKA